MTIDNAPVELRNRALLQTLFNSTVSPALTPAVNILVEGEPAVVPRARVVDVVLASLERNLSGSN